MRRAPPGMRLARSLGAKEWSHNSHRCLVLVLTFVAYACYHASRKPTSIVKSVLDPNSHSPPDQPQPSLSSPPLPWPLGPLFLPPNLLGGTHSHGWAPFNATDGTAKLGEIDVAFLACYSLGMYAAGHLGDHLDLRLFLAAGMIGSGAFVVMFGMPTSGTSTSPASTSTCRCSPASSRPPAVPPPMRRGRLGLTRRRGKLRLSMRRRRGAVRRGRRGGCSVRRGRRWV